VSAWLDPLRAALDENNGPAQWFFRDDDAGWDDPRLFALLDCFSEYSVPVDLAVIPVELRDELADALLQRYADNPNLLGLHQHGFSHANHEVTGRKCEFGVSRSAAQQVQDIERGANLLRNNLGAALDPIFTPPWNRCNSSTVAALQRFGFHALSRDSTALPLEMADLVELPVCVDWSKRPNGVQISNDVLSVNLAAAIKRSTIGVMLHHAVMGPTDLLALRELLELLKQQRDVKCLPMRALVASYLCRYRGP
jgi:peptidoglycan/xylan/chitin deacetylase (PgdA/CDA1 family)